MAVNYLNLDRFPILYNHYVFVDTSDYLADQLFIRHKVRVHFGEEMEHPEFPYIFIFCKITIFDTSYYASFLNAFCGIVFS